MRVDEEVRDKDDKVDDKVGEGRQNGRTGNQKDQQYSTEN